MAGGWRTGRVRFELNRAGVRELLLSQGVAEELERRAHLVASHANELYKSYPVGPREAGSNMPGEHIVAVVKMGEGANRSRARVVGEHPAARAVEAKARVLGASTDAARG